MEDTLGFKRIFVCASMFAFFLTTQAEAQVQTIELTFDGHLCVECELGVNRAVAEKSMGWDTPRYKIEERRQGVVQITTGPRTQLHLSRIASTMKRYVIRAELRQVVVRAAGVVQGAELVFNDQKVLISGEVASLDGKSVVLVGSWVPGTKEVLLVTQALPAR
jgi:hypothetical protein